MGSAIEERLATEPAQTFLVKPDGKEHLDPDCTAARRASRRDYTGRTVTLAELVGPRPEFACGHCWGGIRFAMALNMLDLFAERHPDDLVAWID